MLPTLSRLVNTQSQLNKLEIIIIYQMFFINKHESTQKNPYGINDEVLLDFACVETSFMVFHYCKHILFIIQTLRLVIYESFRF